MDFDQEWLRHIYALRGEVSQHGVISVIPL